MRISIALATYNGEKYIKEQLQSILLQLTAEDEIIISDDSSTDKTLEIISGFCSEQIHIYKNPKKGVISNFENAISHATGDIIILCDQDDVWCPEKVVTIKKYFSKSDVKLIVSDAYITDESLNVKGSSFFELMNSGPGFIKNFLKNTYIGCCMAFRCEMKELILPFPDRIPMHDSWIGLLSELKGKVLFIPEKLIYYRRHDANASALKRDSFAKSVMWRKNLAVELIRRYLR
jgi:glycosyltransferase involved in cell wall biosynthesis